MKSLRISIVQYLNTAPLVRGFTHGPLRGKYELSFTVPSQCAEALSSGAVDIAIIPAIEYQRMDGLVVLPNLSIASKGAVRSLLLIARRPIQQVTRIALDQSSRSTQALTRILCQKRWGIAPEFFEAAPDLPVMLQNADAALLIGDPALRVSLAVEPGGKRDSSGVLRCAGSTAGVPDASELLLYDMVSEWRALTSLPAVLAVWAARRDAVTPEVVRDFQQSLAFGMQHLDEISAEAAGELGLPAAELRRYFGLAAELGLIPDLKEIEMAVPPASTEQLPELAAARRR